MGKDEFTVEDIFTRQDYAEFKNAVEERRPYDFIYFRLRERICRIPKQECIFISVAESATTGYGKTITFIV